MVNVTTAGRIFEDLETISALVIRRVLILALAPVVVSTMLAGCMSGSVVQSGDVGAEGDESTDRRPAIVRPGAPGEATHVYGDAGEVELIRPEYTGADVRFMQGMIHHHAQALEMAALVPDRSTRRDLNLLAKRIEVAQKDEIRLMQDWLERRGEDAPHVDFSTGVVHAAGDGRDGQSGHSGMMPGMLTPDRMDQLRTSEGAEFYRLWITFMIQHHEGALSMVAELFSQDGAAQDQDIFRFASDVDIDQRVEIVRMQQMLAGSR